LGKCNFNEGLIGGLPSNIKAAHKFGEAGDPIEKNLSESAIVYLDNNPYILTVMVKGKEVTKLPEVIKQISATIYQKMSSIAKPPSS
jgi:beta-lactamase class A